MVTLAEPGVESEGVARGRRDAWQHRREFGGFVAVQAIVDGSPRNLNRVHHEGDRTVALGVIILLVQRKQYRRHAEAELVREVGGDLLSCCAAVGLPLERLQVGPAPGEGSERDEEPSGLAVLVELEQTATLVVRPTPGPWKLHELPPRSSESLVLLLELRDRVPLPRRHHRLPPHPQDRRLKSTCHP